MNSQVKDAIRKGAKTRAEVKRRCRGCLVTRVDAAISALLFAGEIVSVRGAFYVA